MKGISKTPSLLPSSNPRVKPLAHPFRHCMPVQIRYTDIDMLGHLNNNVYLMFMDLAKIDYFGTVKGCKIDMHSIDMVVAHLDVSFLAPTFFEEEIEVWTQVTHIGNKSLHIEQRIVEANSGEVKTVCTTVMTGFDPKQNVSIPIDSRWRSAISAYEQHPID